MEKKHVKSVPVAEVPEVVDFLHAQDALAEFQEEHAEVFAAFRGLTEAYNSKLEAAEQAVRARQVKCGPFELKHFATKYDALALYNAVGRDTFLALGGKIGTETTYDIDKGRLDANIAQNKLAADVVEVVRKETPTYTVPKKALVP